MSAQSSQTIPVFEPFEVVEVQQPLGGRPIHPRGVRERIVETSVDVLSQSLTTFIQEVSTMLTTAARATEGPWEIEKIEVQCSVSAGGKIGLPGIGVDLQGGSTFKLVFARKASSPEVGTAP